MGKIGYGYGSEWHLLRHLGYHRQYLSVKALNLLGGKSIEWLDFGFSSENKPLQDDREIRGIDFIEDEEVRERWEEFWPQTGNPQNWDALGKVHYDHGEEWILVEAKSHLDEMHSDCCARSHDSTQKILSALSETSRAFGNDKRPVEAWLRNYYQYANRLAVLYFLMQVCEPAVPSHLLFIYFYGENRKNLKCPQHDYEWFSPIKEKNDWLGIDPGGALTKRIHTLFLPVNPLNTGGRPESPGR